MYCSQRCFYNHTPEAIEAYRRWWSENTSVPYGYCWCGCGRQTSLAAESKVTANRIKGEPVRYIIGHCGGGDRPTGPPNPSGMCMCGCGNPAPLAPKSNTRAGWIKGQPLRYIKNHQHKRRDLPDYLLEDHGHSTPCWIWQKGTDGSCGYGRISYKGKRIGAHRYYYLLYIGSLPSEMELDHLCRVPACVNPEHLEPVTHAENMRRGANSKLSPEDVRIMRRLRNERSLSVADLMHRFGVKESAVRAALNGQTWT